MTNDVESIDKATHVAHPVKDAVRLSVDYHLVWAKVPFHTDELVQARRLLFRRVVNPTTTLYLQFSVVEEVRVFWYAKLEKLSLVFEQVSLNKSVNPAGSRLVNLLVHQVRFSHNSILIVLIYTEHFILMVDYYVDIP